MSDEPPIRLPVDPGVLAGGWYLSATREFYPDPFRRWRIEQMMMPILPAPDPRNLIRIIVP